MSVIEATESGTHRDVVRALLWRASVAVDDPATRGNALASLLKVASGFAAELAELEVKAEADAESGFRLHAVDEAFDPSAI